MTAAELAQAFCDSGDTRTGMDMLHVLSALRDTGHGETAALAIAAERVREMWAKRGCYCWSHEESDRGSWRVGIVAHMDGKPADLRWHGDTIADCLEAALQAALETTDG